MKKILGLSVAAAIALSTPALAEDTTKFTVSGSAALTTNYIWRGISYTENTATGQAGIDMENVAGLKGLHLNLWGSGIQEGSEMDTILGYATEIGSVGVDVGYINYYYTRDYAQYQGAGTFAGASYGEAFVALSYSDFGLSYYREAGYNGSSYDNGYDGNTIIVDASFGPVDLSWGTRIGDESGVSSFGSVGVNWPCQLLKGYDMNAMVAYNDSVFASGQTLFDTEGLTFALTISKGF